jgi:hypothetical protein
VSSSDFTGERRLRAAQICGRYSIGVRTLFRWCQDPQVGFPAPLVIQRRRYWREEDLQAWERAQTASERRLKVA